MWYMEINVQYDSQCCLGMTLERQRNRERDGDGEMFFHFLDKAPSGKCQPCIRHNEVQLEWPRSVDNWREEEEGSQYLQHRLACLIKGHAQGLIIRVHTLQVREQCLPSPLGLTATDKGCCLVLVRSSFGHKPSKITSLDTPPPQKKKKKELWGIS